MTFYGRVYDGRFRADDIEAYLRELVRREGKRVQLEITGIKRQRTPEQNRYYWSILQMSFEQLGYPDAESLHRSLQACFLADTSGPLPKVRSTKDLSTIEFMAYISQVVAALHEQGVIVPLPE